MSTLRQRPQILGKQLRSAREILGLSRRDAARRLNVAEGDLEQWEGEIEQPSADILWDIADLYKRSPDYFLKSTPDIPRNIDYRLTTRGSLDQLSLETRAVIAQFEELCRWQYELEQIIGTTHEPTLPRVPPNTPPEAAAAEERARLEVGDLPVKKPRDLIQGQGVRVFELEVPGGEFAGFSWWGGEYGPCVLLNASDSTGRRNFTLAHEYAHLLLRREATICDLFRQDDDETYANSFAACFLMPEDDVRITADRFAVVRIVPGANDLAPLANRYGVSLEAMGRRLEGLGLIPRGSTDQRIEEWQQFTFFRRRAKRPGWRRRLGEPFVTTSFDAYSRGAISLSRLAELLGLDIRKARDAYQKEFAEGASE